MFFFWEDVGGIVWRNICVYVYTCIYYIEEFSDSGEIRCFLFSQEVNYTER